MLCRDGYVLNNGSCEGNLSILVIPLLLLFIVKITNRVGTDAVYVR